MHVEGSHTFSAPRQQVWQSLLDPAVLASCLPGCEDFQPIGDGRYQATLTVGVANVKGTYKSTIELADIKEPESYRLLVEGGGRPGSIKGEGHLQLSEAEGGTTVAYQGNVQVTGMVARVGQRLLPGVAKMMIGNFFKCLEEKVGANGDGAVSS